MRGWGKRDQGEINLQLHGEINFTGTCEFEFTSAGELRLQWK